MSFMEVGNDIDNGKVYIAVGRQNHEVLQDVGGKRRHAIVGLDEEDVDFLVRALRKELRRFRGAERNSD